MCLSVGRGQGLLRSIMFSTAQCCCPAGWRSCFCALMSTLVWVPPVWRAPLCACFTSLTTASRTGLKSVSLAPCSPAWTLWSWPTTTWPPFRTARTSCSGSSPTYAASTCTTQVRGCGCLLVVCVCCCYLGLNRVCNLNSKLFFTVCLCVSRLTVN